jgi:hypothetical protein
MDGTNYLNLFKHSLNHEHYTQKGLRIYKFNSNNCTVSYRPIVRFNQWLKFQSIINFIIMDQDQCILNADSTLKDASGIE